MADETPVTHTDTATSDDAILLDMDAVPSALAPSMPAWLATLIAAIGAIVPLPPDVAFEALRALVAPFMATGARRGEFLALPLAMQTALRNAMESKQTAIAAARRAPVVVPPAPPTVEQPIPVVRDVAPEQAPAPLAAEPRMVSPMVHPARWAPLMRAANGALRECTNQERARRVDPSEWGVRVDTAAPLTVGALVRVEGRRGSSVHVLTAIVTASAVGGQWTTIAAVRAATEVDRAPRPVQSAPRFVSAVPDMPRMPEGAIPLSAMMPDAVPASVIPSAPVVSAPVASGTTIEADLAGIASEGSRMAATVPTTAPIRTSGRFGQSVTTTGTANVRAADGQAMTERARLLSERHLILGNLAADGWLQVSWTGERQTTHGAVSDALIAVGRESDAPGEPSAEHFASEALNVLRGRSWDIRRVGKSDVPATDDNGRKIKARWIVGRVGAVGDADAGDAYGSIRLRVDLILVGGDDEGTLVFDGDPGLADQVRAEYTARLSGVVLTSRVLTPWLGRVLRVRHGAVKRGHCWYVPPGHASAVRALIGGPGYAARVAEIVEMAKSNPEAELPALPAFDKGSIGALWGDHELQACSTGPDLFASLTRGLATEAQRITDDLARLSGEARDKARAKAEEKARKRHNASDAYIAQEGQAAWNRATIGAEVASRLLRETGTVAARVSGYEAVLGAASVTNAKRLIEALRACLEPLADDTSLRGAMLELE